jgi:hypothetical protein
MLTKDKLAAREQIRLVENGTVGLDSFLYIEGFFPGSLSWVFLSHQKATIPPSATFYGDTRTALVSLRLSDVSRNSCLSYKER